MDTITRSDFSNWCTKRGLDVVDREWPRYRDAGRHSFLLKLPELPYRSVALARMCFPGTYDESFRGAMVWIREWGIWAEIDEATAMYVIEQLRAAHGRTEPLIESPGHVFSHSEFVDARAFWTWPMIVGWDAILFPEAADYFVFNSHDEVVCFVARTKEKYGLLLNEFKDWKPEETEWYFR
jgi:hypothetical protein